MKLPQTLSEFGRCIDQTALRPDGTAADIERMCADAKSHGFAAVCVHGSRVELARHYLESSDVKVCGVVGFPFGATESDVKRFETEAAIEAGAQEIDVVLNAGLLKDGQDCLLLRELRDVVESAEERPVKVILEMSLLTREEIVRACTLVLDSGAHFVKTSTGAGVRPVTVDDVRLLRSLVGPEFGVKAAGGIRTLDAAMELATAGANRLGTSSGPALMEQFRARLASPGQQPA